MLYPINLNLKQKKCLVIGGGHVAERKIRGLLEAKADVTVISPAVTEYIAKLETQNKLAWIRDSYKQGVIKGYFLLIAATSDDDVNRLAIQEANDAKILANAPTMPEMSDFFVPATLRRGDLLATVSTEGASPAFSRLIKEEFEAVLPNNIEEWLGIIKKIRLELKTKLTTSREREIFWRNALNKKVLALLKEDRVKDAEVELRNGISCDGIKP